MNLSDVESGKKEVLIPQMAEKFAKDGINMVFCRNPKVFGSKLGNKIATFHSRKSKIKFSYLEPTYLGSITVTSDGNVLFTFFNRLPSLTIYFTDVTDTTDVPKTWCATIEGELNIEKFIDELEKFII
ncbi:MAG TPA: hypothetical protein PLK76_03195 [bacterium]|nr:hypothetical protein [bacterium]